ncbi:PfkB family carbohydrate kinase, partial [Amylibacter sp.]|nr:PfkB family carbohydrate kinase [Amylibacter sp.]
MKVDFISKCYGPTGHAIIFVDESGENEIIIHPGANNQFSKSQCFEILQNFTSKDTWIVLQNEINLSVEIAIKAKELGFKVCYSAAPFNSDHVHKILPYVDLLAMNETELKELQNSLEKNVSDLDVGMILVTLGSRGAELHMGNSTFKQSSFLNKAVDTTGAGDTFLGSFIACYDNGYDTEKALEYAAAAASIQITRIGAAKAIPTFEEVQDFINERKE